MRIAHRIKNEAGACNEVKTELTHLAKGLREQSPFEKRFRARSFHEFENNLYQRKMSLRHNDYSKHPNKMIRHAKPSLNSILMTPRFFSSKIEDREKKLGHRYALVTTDKFEIIANCPYSQLLCPKRRATTANDQPRPNRISQSPDQFFERRCMNSQDAGVRLTTL